MILDTKGVESKHFILESMANHPLILFPFRKYVETEKGKKG